jgi:hypothetical protein
MSSTIQAELEKAKDRGVKRVKQTAEVFTPLDLCLQMVREIPEDKLEDPSTVYLDNSCGDGNFLVALLQVLTEDYGHPREQVLTQQIYGIDLMPDNVVTAKERTGCDNVFCSDALDFDYTSLPGVDVIVGNPPYQRGKFYIFYETFFRKCLSLLSEGGYISYIVPNKFLIPTSKVSRTIRSNLQVQKMYASVNDWFPKVGTRIGRFTGVKTTGSDLKAFDLVLEDGNVLSYDMSEQIPICFSTLESIQELRELTKGEPIPFQKTKPETKYYVTVDKSWVSGGFNAQVCGENAYTVRYVPCVSKKEADELVLFLKTSPKLSRIHRLFSEKYITTWHLLTR